MMIGRSHQGIAAAILPAALALAVAVLGTTAARAEAQDLLLALPDGADVAPRLFLRANVVVDGDLVTAGDLLEGESPKADRPLFRAPDLGRSGTVSAADVLSALASAGITGVYGGGLDRVTVSRRSHPVGGGEMADLVRQALADALGADPAHVDVTFDREPAAAHAAPQSAVPVELASLSRSAAGRFEAVLLVDQGTQRERIRLTGTAVEIAEIVTPTRPIARDEPIGIADLEVARVPAAGRLAVAPPIESLIGLVARRDLRPGAAVSAADFAQPLLVRRGELVTLTYRSAAMTLTVSGKAMADGAADSIVPVMNLRSNRIIQTRVTGAGTVEVAHAGRRLAAVEERANP